MDDHCDNTRHNDECKSDTGDRPWVNQERLGRANCDDNVKEWQPPKTPPKHASCGDHAEQKNDQKENQFPFDAPNELSTTRNKPRNEDCWSDKAAR
jgi:hypothetical protein